MINIAQKPNRGGNIDRYPSYPDETVKWRRGRRPTKLHRTMVNLNVGEKFLYPYTTAKSVYRKAAEISIEVMTRATNGGFWITRID